MRFITIAPAADLGPARLLERTIASVLDASLLIIVVDAASSVSPMPAVGTPIQDLIDGPTLTRCLLAVNADSSRRRLSEQATMALVPHVLTELIERDGEDVVFLSPNTVVQAPSPILTADSRDVVWLARRLSRPLPADERTPAMADLLTAGAISPAVVRADAGSASTVRWWRDRSWNNPDAHWLDVLANLFAVCFADQDETPLTSWNWHEWTITAPPADGAIGGRALTRRTNGGPAHRAPIVQLADFDPDTPWLWSNALDNPHPRILLSEHPDVALWCQQIAAELAPADRTEDVDRSDGIDATMRMAYQQVRRNGVLTELDAAPVDTDTMTIADVRRWLRGPLYPGAPISRYLYTAYRDRSDLQAAFPNVARSIGVRPHPDDRALAQWAKRHGASDPRYQSSLLVAEQPPASSSTQQSKRPTPGVNLVGYLASGFGLGAAARRTHRALAAAAVPVHTVVESPTAHATDRSLVDDVAETSSFDTTIVCVNADHISPVLRRIPDLTARSYVIGQWFWELEEFPSQPDFFNGLNEIWAATSFVRDALTRVSPIPVTLMPLPLLEEPTTEPTRLPAEVSSERDLFLFCFDWLSTAERKNPLGLVEAFTQAFQPNEGPQLVIKTINSYHRVAQAERLRVAVANRPDIVVLDRFLDTSELNALFAASTCYVSLHRAEGLGLTLAKAMSYGRPVIATDYSGSTDFLNATNGYPVPWRYTTVPPGADPYRAGARWAEPNVGAAAELMRHVMDHPEEATARGRQAAIDLARLHSPEVTGARMAERLAWIRGHRTTLRTRQAIARASAGSRAAIQTAAETARKTARRLGR